MKNNETMTLNINRIDVCDIRLAITNMISKTRRELNDENTSEYRKEILTRTLKKWERIHAEIVLQFDDQDKQ